MKYIDAEKLIAKIENMFDNGYYCTPKNIGKQRGRNNVCRKILSLITSLQQEQPEVDLEKALNGLDNAYFDLDGIAVMGATYYLTVNDLKDIARDFYELGKNSK